MDKHESQQEWEQRGPYTRSFSWRAQLGAAVFTASLRGDVGYGTKIMLWGRPWTKEDPIHDWEWGHWNQFAVKVVTLSLAAPELRKGNLPIEPTLIRELLTEAFGSNPPDATFHLPHRLSRPIQLG